MRLYFCQKAQLPEAYLRTWNDIALSITKEYNQMIAQIGTNKKHSLAWWASETASRNTATPHGKVFFTQLSYIALSKHLLENGEKIEEIITDDKHLARLLKQCFWIKNNNVQIIYQGKENSKIALLKTYLATAKDLILRFFFAKITQKNINIPKNSILVDMFVLPNSFQNGQYQDRYYHYFGLKKQDLEKIPLVYVPTLLNLSAKKIYEAFVDLRQHQNPVFLCKEDFLGFWDILKILFLPIQNFFWQFPKVYFNEIDISILIQNLHQNSILGSSVSHALQNYYFIKNFSKLNYEPKLFIDWLENQSIDKALHFALEKFMPQLKRVGYLVCCDSRYYLSIHPTAEEKNAKVLPHLIYSTGRGGGELVGRFCQDLDIATAPAFRYAHVHSVQTQKRKDFFVVLVALPIVESDALAIIRQISEIAVQPNLRFQLKTHPSYDLDIFEHQAQKLLNSAMSFVRGSFEKYLHAAHLLITAGSTTALEALALGVPVLVSGSSSSLSENVIPQKLSQKIWRMVYTSQELGKALDYFAGLDQSQKQEIQEIAQYVREQYFEQVTWESTKKFLDLDDNFPNLA